jgi:hypothetical protein
MRRILRYQSADGYVFFQQPDGSLTDTEDPDQADMTYVSLDELKKYVDVELVSD